MALEMEVLMLKKLLLSSFFGLSFVSLHGMVVAPKIKYEGPQITYSKRDFEINALDDNFEIGSIMYELLPLIKTDISLFEVNKKYRNNKVEYVGQNLFQRCIDHALSRQCPLITWTVIPQDKENLDLETVCLIYEKMVKKLKNADNFTFAKSKPYGCPLKVDMTLSVKQ